MPYYHIRLFYYVKKNPPLIGQDDQVNLQKPNLIKGVLEPYLSGKEFMFGFKKFTQSDVADIKIITTPKTILEFMKDIYCDFVPGTDVTKEILEETKKKDVNDKLDQLMFIPDEVYGRLPKPVKRLIEGIRLNFEYDFADFCFMGIRKALAVGIQIRFKMEGKEDILYDTQRRPYSLTKWIEFAKQNKFLSSSLAVKLQKEVKVFGDIGSHDYEIDFSKEEVTTIFKLLRLALNKLFYNV